MTYRFARALGACLALTTSLAFAQTTETKPGGLTFEVATIKPAQQMTAELVTSGKFHAGMSVDGARVDIGFFAISDLIRTAYKLQSYQISGPDYINSQRFDILAKMPEGATKEQVPEMLQALLAERFKLTVHRDTKEHTVYALVQGKGGSKMKEAEPDVETPPPAESDAKKSGFTLGAGSNQMRVSPSGDGKGATISGGATGMTKMSMGPNGTMRMEFAKMPMKQLVAMVGRFVDRPVLDMTELTGNYQVALDLSMEDMKNVARASGMGGMMMMGAAAGGASTAPSDTASEPTSSIFATIQQLGLKLESRKAPIELLVIDHVEKMPTEN